MGFEGLHVYRFPRAQTTPKTIKPYQLLASFLELEVKRLIAAHVATVPLLVIHKDVDEYL